MAGKKLNVLVENFGFSLDALKIMGKFAPKASKNQLALVVKGFAKFLLKAESPFEKRWLNFDKVCVEDMFSSPVLITRPKPCTFKLPANDYTPDFLYLLEDGQRIYVEVKASKFQNGYQDAIAKLRMTATLYYYDTYVLAMPDKESKNGWNLKIIPPDVEFGGILNELYNQLDSDLQGEQNV